METVHSVRRRAVGVCQIGLAVTLMVGGAQAMAHPPDDGPESVQKVSGAPGHVVWKIVRPRVTQARTDYPQITFASGNIVKVDATGCVQTGGSGDTWKRYVDPAGPGSDKLYHGLISIPGATPGLVRFNPTQPTVYFIPATGGPPANQMHLALGYEDNGYADNGYWSRDNGNLKQCSGVSDATLTIDIGPAVQVAPAPAEMDYTFNIDNVTIRNLRSRDSDTDVLASAVTVNGTTSGIGNQSVGDWKGGSHPVSFPVLIEQVRPDNRIDVVYTIVNAGASNAQQIDNAITAIIGKAGSAIPIVGEYMAAAAAAAQALFNIADPNCDGPVVAGSVFGTGQDMALWTQDGPYTRTLSFPGTDSAPGCGANSFYEVTYTISRTPAVVPREFLVKVNAPKLLARAPDAVVATHRTQR